MWCLLTTHIEWQSECCISVIAMKTQTTNSFNFRCVGNQQVYLFFGLLRHFFQEWMDAHFLGAPSRDRTWLSVFRPFYCVLEAFLKKRMALPIWKSYVRCWRKNRNSNIKFNVIELYVIKSSWKIKFNKRKVYHQLSFFFFFLSVKLALKNLDKLDYVVTELILRKNKVWPTQCRFAIVFFL